MLTAFVDTMPGAGNTTNSTFVLDLEGELGVQEPTHYCDSGKFLCEHSWGKGNSGERSGKAKKRSPVSPLRAGVYGLRLRSYRQSEYQQFLPCKMKRLRAPGTLNSRILCLGLEGPCDIFKLVCFRECEESLVVITQGPRPKPEGSPRSHVHRAMPG